MQLTGRTISRSDYDQLHAGMKRLATAYGWRIIEPGDTTEPDITLATLGLAPAAPAPEISLDDWALESSQRDDTAVEPVLTEPA